MEALMAAHGKTARSRETGARKALTRKGTVSTSASKTTSKKKKAPTGKARAPRRQSNVKQLPAKSSAKRTSAAKRWSQRVTRESDALDLKRGVFTLTDPKKIAASLKRSAEVSSRRKTGAYRSALSMLTFYINRAGKTLPKTQRDRLQRAKTELKHRFGRE
jgi:hypothetical protein